MRSTESSPRLLRDARRRIRAPADFRHSNGAPPPGPNGQKRVRNDHHIERSCFHTRTSSYTVDLPANFQEGSSEETRRALNVPRTPTAATARTGSITNCGPISFDAQKACDIYIGRDSVVRTPQTGVYPGRPPFI
jgi:hypothetical protein